MSRKQVFAAGGAAVAVLAAALVVRLVAHHNIYIRGAVVARDPDPAKEIPVADTAITVVGGPPGSAVRTDNAGYFSIPIPLQRLMRLGGPVTLDFEHPDYQPFELRDVRGDQLYIVHLAPLPHPGRLPSHAPEIKITHVIASYSINTTTALNIGSAVKTFQVVNIANVPCKGPAPCSPDGKWKAAIANASLDAGPGNEFRNARASCIAGPCPFTKIVSDNFANNQRILRVATLDWSDTATFLLEAEVYKPLVSDVLRQSYPVTFDRVLTFTIPAAAEGVSIEAELDGTMIIFPLGPKLFLSWAHCQLQINKDQTKVYRCELKPGYRFSS